jgi:hypothetical protein
MKTEKVALAGYTKATVRWPILGERTALVVHLLEGLDHNSGQDRVPH